MIWEWKSVKDNIWKWRVINVFPGSCQNGFLLAPFCWEHLTSHEKFPNKWKPKLQLVDQGCAGGSSHSVVALAGCFPWKSPGWDGFPAPTGILLQRWASLRPGLFPSFPRGSQPLWLQLILVGQPRGSLRDVCVFQGLFLIPEDGDRATFPGFLWQWCCCLRRQLPFVLATGATTTAQGWARRKRSQEGKTGSLFIQMPWQWIGCNYSLKYSLVLIVWVAGNRRKVKPNPVKKKPKLLIRWILHFLKVNSENRLPGICLGEGFIRAELKKKISELNSIVNGKEKSWISVKTRTFFFQMLWETIPGHQQILRGRCSSIQQITLGCWAVGDWHWAWMQLEVQTLEC